MSLILFDTNPVNDENRDDKPRPDADIHKFELDEISYSEHL